MQARKNMMDPGNKHYQMVQEQMQIYERFDQGRDIDSTTCKNQYSGSAYCFNEKCFVDEHMALYKTCWYNKEPDPEAPRHSQKLSEPSASQLCTSSFA